MNNFTLLVPTRGRATLLRRLLAYYESEKFPHPIIIADSSAPPILEENRDTVSRCRTINIEHRAFDPSTEIFEKIMSALTTVGTSHVGLCADDDFVAASSIRQSLAFLEKHPRYSAVEGRSFMAEPGRERLHLSAYPQREVKGATAKTRIESYFENPTSNFYAIYRTGVFKDILARISRYRTDNTRFEELAVSSLGAIRGNVGVLPTLYMVRQSSRDRTDSGSQQTGGWRTIAEAPSFTKDRGRFIDMLTEALCEHGMEQVPARNLIIRCFDDYLAQALGTRESPRRLSLKERVIAATLSPASGTSLVRKIGAIALMHISPRLRALRAECTPIITLIEEYPNGISKV